VKFVFRGEDKTQLPDVAPVEPKTG